MTDEDKTLLEMAAKAAGLQYIKPAEGYSGSLGLEVGSDNPMRCYSWNPLEDDGDTLRLMVQLGLGIYRGHDASCGGFCEVFYRSRKYAREKSCIEYHEDHKDKYTATRRAIVRAAAEIGKTQQ